MTYIWLVVPEKDTIYTVLLAIALLLMFAVFVAVAVLKLKRYGGSISSTTMYGATDAFYDKDKRRGIEMVVEQKAGKKMEEQKTGEGKQKERK